jgi:integrase
MLPMLWLEDDELDRFLASLEEHWGPSTLESSIASLLKPAIRIGVPQSRLVDLKDIIKMFKRKRMERGGWDPDDPVQVVTPAEAGAILKEVETQPDGEARRILVAAFLAWTTSARIGDILKVQTKNCDLRRSTIILTEHKTVTSIGPVTFHLPPKAMQLVQELMKSEEEQPRRYLFLPRQLSNRLENEVRAAEQRLKRLSNTLRQKDLRGLRRGGIISASEIATSTGELRVVTHHRPLG